MHALKHSSSAQAAVRSAWKVVSNRTRRCPTRCTDPVWTKPRGQGGAPPPPTIIAIASALPRLLTATAAPAMTWLPLNGAIVEYGRAPVLSSS